MIFSKKFQNLKKVLTIKFGIKRRMKNVFIFSQPVTLRLNLKRLLIKKKRTVLIKDMEIDVFFLFLKKTIFFVMKTVRGIL